MVFANESDPTAQAAHAHSLYVGSSSYPSGSYTDQIARYASTYSAPYAITNAQISTLTPPYTSNYMVQVAANRAGVDANPEDTQNVEDLEQEVRVGAALASSYGIWNAGGPIGNFTASNYQSPYVDSLWLAEASKQTGRKLF